jgi:hypothetical protein
MGVRPNMSIDQAAHAMANLQGTRTLTKRVDQANFHEQQPAKEKERYEVLLHKSLVGHPVKALLKQYGCRDEYRFYRKKVKTHFWSSNLLSRHTLAPLGTGAKLSFQII